MTQSAKALLQEIHAYIEEAGVLVEQEDAFALEGLNDKVKILCESVQAMPKEEAVKYHDELSALSEQLDSLQRRMIAHRDEIGERINGISLHRKASQAYSKSNASVPRSDDNNNE